MTVSEKNHFYVVYYRSRISRAKGTIEMKIFLIFIQYQGFRRR